MLYLTPAERVACAQDPGLGGEAHQTASDTAIHQMSTVAKQLGILTESAT